MATGGNNVAPVAAATFVYDCEGNKLDELIAVNSNRIIVTQDKIPENLAHAFVAIEDERFYQNNGIDYKGMVRSGYQFIKTFGKETHRNTAGRRPPHPEYSVPG